MGSGGRRHAAPRGEPPEPAPARATLRGPGEGRADRRRAARRIRRRRRLRATREIPLLIGMALLIALGLKTFLVQAFVIPSGSMEETIRVNDRVLVDKLTPWFGWEPQRGDVVVFEDPGGWLASTAQTEGSDLVVIAQVTDLLTWIGLLPSDDDQDLIKRVIGVGGDTVACCDGQGRVTVNGTPVEEDYLYPGNPPSEIEFSVTVPEGRIFVMGDHRSNSADSRYHLDDSGDGTVPVDLVVGRAVAVAWPFSHWKRLDGSESFAAVPEPDSGRGDARASPGVTPEKTEEVAVLPSPAELPLVMGVVSLLRVTSRPERSVRSDRGGCSGRCTVWRGRAGGGTPPPWRRAGWRGPGDRWGTRRRYRACRGGRTGRAERRGRRTGGRDP